MDNRLLRLPEVMEITGLAKATIYKWMRLGTFPDSVKLGSASAWRESDIRKWVADR